MGRANRAPVGAELMPEIPLAALKEVEPLERISAVEAHNYMRANQNARPIAEPGQGKPVSTTPEGE